MNKRILNGLFFVGSFTLVGCTATDSMPTETKQPAPKVNSVSAEVISSWIDSKVLAPEGCRSSKTIYVIYRVAPT